MTSVREHLLLRQGLVFIDSDGTTSENTVRALALELAELGYVPSDLLARRLSRASLDEVVSFRAWLLRSLQEHLGLGPSHRPLFRKFPDGVPVDTTTLWWGKVLVHFLQGASSACLFCGGEGTTHVLSPCAHVVCSRCWDGGNYSACPVCEHAVDQSSPFFLPSPERPLPEERVRFQVLQLGADFRAEAQNLFQSLAARQQALSPDDRIVLVSLVTEMGARVLSWIPDRIPVRENVATIFGTLAKMLPVTDVLAAARPHLRTATDVLRVISVLSDGDGSLQGKVIYKEIPTAKGTRHVVHRFKPARMSRAVRRGFLALLDAMPRERLIEDMRRHPSEWVSVGEALHPGEYEDRYPNAYEGFHVVRGRSPKAPRARVRPPPTWASRFDAILRDAAWARLPELLAERPGEFARRLDQVLRVVPEALHRAVLSVLREKITEFATPVLVTLFRHLASRLGPPPAPSRQRVFFPKGEAVTGVSAPDGRAQIPRESALRAYAAVRTELLIRFGELTHFDEAIVDEALGSVPVPFNERTQSRGTAVPRGSRIAIADGKLARFCLHWCEPERDGHSTDLDLSVGFYSETWQHLGVCSFYQLQAFGHDGAVLARSAGDLRSAPFPDGATEYVDVDLDLSRKEGIRYAVMLVTNFHGLPYAKLSRAFAGVMFRNDPFGRHFDPRTMPIQFVLAGENGVVLPMVVDLVTRELHWLDLQQKGRRAFNSLHSSDENIRRLGSEILPYFAERPSLGELAALHAAARARRVFVRRRDGTISQYLRRPDEAAESFFSRLALDKPDEQRSRLPRGDGPAKLAILLRGDLELPEGSAIYALFRENLTPTLSASDLLSAPPRSVGSVQDP